ncbi:MAG: TetR/AcrR family transcriptional regulator [Lentisphaerae bacterium]|jgi:TetR/AcrR family transcriptional regulator, regulator of cefoperazone and chloramphenicol sensitivity|nr:TetR/AcrR family transcriptional regulator [Lentisphaerota bacterium]MBT4817112.1 TetR/AcrR family transcriptional regulator [Lentisphaerota bacterium]MBT5608508.1 TetR/AcrR family transcriptional regulator [Lentisphaerota bacterium]MBT7058516.1 TetR/AcrR family transcriptional regulator [Lentisphaerota bacterium]MBT7843225.1 TetR/AcrR family transcriptional regulator [Lentisphaerota bacterium]
MARKATGTRERILDAACELIAEKGYAATTHQAICDAADANIAAINYYFGSKEELYAKVWSRAFEQMHEAHGVAPGEGMPPEDALMAIVRARLEGVFDEGPGGHFAKIIFHSVHEHGHETTRKQFDRDLKPMMERFHRVVQGVLGPKATEMHVSSCAFSIHSQCVHLNVARRQGIGHGILADRNPPPESQEKLIRMMLTFVAGGVRHMRDQIDQGNL